MIRRVAAAAIVVAVAVLCVPAALPAGMNAADLIIIFAPITVVAIVARRRRIQTPAGGVASPSVDASPSVASLAGSLSDAEVRS